MKHEDEVQLIGDLQRFAQYGSALEEGCSRVEAMLANIKAKKRLRAARAVVAQALASDNRGDLTRAQTMLKDSLASLLTE
jgi:hypothetical protein